MASIIVLFEAIIKDGKMEDYLAHASALKAHLAQAEGFVRSERFSSLETNGNF